MNAPAFARCHCAECQRLDALPVRRHGIPHAWQPDMLASYAPQAAPPAVAQTETPAPQRECDSLPLFAGSLEPNLL